MDVNKMIFRGVKVGFILLLVLLIVYGTMQASFFAYEYGYRFAIESLIDNQQKVQVNNSGSR